MPSADDNPENPYHDGNEKRADKEVGGRCKSKAGIAHATEIEDSDDDQNADTDGNCVRQEGWNGRNQGTHSGGNPHSGG